MNNNLESFNSKEHKSEDNQIPVDIILILKNAIKGIILFLKQILNIREGTDIEGTITGIKKDIDFKGPNVFILICSIFIASIGLNVNSIPIIIGAMLISPLMGPILGIGLSVGINDWKTLLRSLKSFSIAVAVSLITSGIYFLLTPLHDIQPELIARTKPTILDVFVAIFGGMAGIIAGSRKEKSNVIPGVAIATALMPPLCTAGYGLATANISFFFGAFYLFLLNSIFISISTIVFVRYLKFPLIVFVNPERERKVKQYIIGLVLVVVIPSGFIFWDVIKEDYFRIQTEKFIVENVQFSGSEVISKRINHTDTSSVIHLFMTGKLLTNKEIQYLTSRMQEYHLNNTFFIKNTFDNIKLNIHQAEDPTNNIKGEITKDIKVGVLEELYTKNERMIKNKDEQIAFLERKIHEYQKNEVDVLSLEKEIKILYNDITRFGYAKMIETNFLSTPDTLPIFTVSWKREIDDSEIIRQKTQLSKWLKVKLDIDTLKIIRY